MTSPSKILDYSNINAPTFVDFLMTETPTAAEKYFEGHDDSWISVRSPNPELFSLGNIQDAGCNGFIKPKKRQSKSIGNRKSRKFGMKFDHPDESSDDIPLPKVRRVRFLNEGSKSEASDCHSTGIKPRLNLNQRSKKLALQMISTRPLGKRSATTAEVAMNFKNTLRRPEGQSTTRRRLRLTRPSSPKLQSSLRTRPVTVLSRKEEEDIEVEKMKVFRFKAQPFILKAIPNSSFPCSSQISPRPRTYPKPFHLETSKRAVLFKPPLEPTPKVPVFKANEFPEYIKKGVSGLVIKPLKNVTEPRSPDFALKQREVVWHQQKSPKMEVPVEETPLGKYVTSARNSSIPTKVPAVKTKNTVLEPFSFDQRDQTSAALKAERIQKEIREERQRHEFVANSQIPSPSWRSKLPPPVKLNCTIPEPFPLSSNQTSERWLKAAAEFEKSWCERYQFKAQPCTVLNKAPFQPIVEHKCTQEHVEFSLNTTARVEQRRPFEERLKEQEEMKLKELEKREMEIRLQEEQAVAEIRVKAIHRARPAPVSRIGFKVEKSSLPTTVAVSPHFKTEERVRSKSEK